MGSIYQPAEDSYFFSEFLKKYFKSLKKSEVRYLDMGTGSGILAKTAEKFIPVENIFASDINPDAISALKKEKFNILKSDLFENISGKFDLITFNAPYLPGDPREPKDSQVATTGGKNGDEISLRFLKQAGEYLENGGKIFLLVSSLTPLKEIQKFSKKVVASKKIDFEELLILEISRKNCEDR